MSSHDYKSAQRPNPDELLVAIADYTKNYQVDSAQAYETARYCLMDTLACGFQALKYPACTRLLGPVVPGATMPGGSRVPGTSYELDPVMGAFSIGAMVRWLDFNDTWLAAEWGHPSDNLGAILAVSDYLSRRAILLGREAADGARRTHRDDQGARNPGRAGAGEQLQPRGPRPRAAGARRVDGGRHGDARRLARADRERAVERVDRRRRIAHLSPRAQHRLAQELGRGRRHEPRGAPCVVRAEERNGLSVGAERENLGLPGRVVQGQAADARATARQLRHGKRAVQDQLSRRSSTRRRRWSARWRCTRR